MVLVVMWFENLNKGMVAPLASGGSFETPPKTPILGTAEPDGYVAEARLGELVELEDDKLFLPLVGAGSHAFCSAALAELRSPVCRVRSALMA